MVDDSYAVSYIRRGLRRNQYATPRILRPQGKGAEIREISVSRNASSGSNMCETVLSERRRGPIGRQSSACRFPQCPRM